MDTDTKQEEKLLSPTKVSVAAFPDSGTYVTEGKPLKLFMVATLTFEDGHTVDTRKAVELDISEEMRAYGDEARKLFMRQAVATGAGKPMPF